MRNSRPEVTMTSGAVGAFVSGVDLSRPLGDETASALRSALDDHGVLFFRDQKLTPEQHIAFAEVFGPNTHDVPSFQVFPIGVTLMRSM